MGRLARAWLFALAVATLTAPIPVAAHAGNPAAGRVTVVQDVGPYPLTFTLEQAGPSQPLVVEVAPEPLPSSAAIGLAVVPAGAFAEPSVRLPLAANDPSPVAARFPLGEAGPWELVVEANGGEGVGAARIPFEVAVPRSSPAGTVLRGALVLGGLLLAALVGLVAIGPRPGLPRRLLPGLVATTGLTLAVAAVAGVLTVRSAPAGAEEVAAVGGPRPYVNATISTGPAPAPAGEPVVLDLALTDGSTGRPVDDLVPNHEALMHAVLVSDDGAFFAHVHPARVGPGRYRALVTPDRAGSFTFYAEVARRGSGSQLLAKPLSVVGAAPAPPPPAASPLGRHEIDGLVVVGEASTPAFRAGEPAALTFRLSRDGQPAPALQPWLGMPGHLLARSGDGAIIAHVHAAGTAAPAANAGAENGPIPGVLAEPTATAAGFAPVLSFTFTPPQEGVYRLWLQFKTDDRIHTLPLAFTAEPAEATT